MSGEHFDAFCLLYLSFLVVSWSVLNTMCGPNAIVFHEAHSNGTYPQVSNFEHLQRGIVELNFGQNIWFNSYLIHLIAATRTSTKTWVADDGAVSWSQEDEPQGWSGSFRRREDNCWWSAAGHFTSTHARPHTAAGAGQAPPQHNGRPIGYGGGHETKAMRSLLKYLAFSLPL